MIPKFFFDTADIKYIKDIWKGLSFYIPSEAVLGVTTNPNALNKIGCNTLSQLETDIPRICEAVTEIKNGSGGVVFVQTPSSEMTFIEIKYWADYISKLSDGVTRVGMKIPHFTECLLASNYILDSEMEINVTGVSDWATLLKAMTFPNIKYASIITGRMDERGIDSDSHLRFLRGIPRKANIIAGSMRTITGLKQAIENDCVPTIGTRLWDIIREKGLSEFAHLWNLSRLLDPRDISPQYCPTISEDNINLSKEFFEQMDKLGSTMMEEFYTRA